MVQSDGFLKYWVIWLTPKYHEIAHMMTCHLTWDTWFRNSMAWYVLSNFFNFINSLRPNAYRTMHHAPMAWYIIPGWTRISNDNGLSPCGIDLWPFIPWWPNQNQSVWIVMNSHLYNSRGSQHLPNIKHLWRKLKWWTKKYHRGCLYES